MPFYVNSQPGTNAANANGQDYSVISINIWFQKGECVSYMAAPVTVSGTATDQPSNAPYDFVIMPGQMFGLITTGSQAGKYGSSISGLTIGAVAAGATSITTDLNTAAEIVRRYGSSGTFTLAGPPNAGGVFNSQVVTYSAVNTTSTGVITCTALTYAFISGSLIQPTDGSQNIRTVYGWQYPFKVKDVYNVVRTDVTVGGLAAASGGAIIEDGYVLQIGSSTISDTTLVAYIKAALGAALPGTNFRSNQNT